MSEEITEEPVAPVTEGFDYCGQIDLLLSAVANVLALSTAAPSILAPGALKQAEVWTQQAREFLLKYKEHSHGE